MNEKRLYETASLACEHLQLPKRRKTCDNNTGNKAAQFNHNGILSSGSGNYDAAELYFSEALASFEAPDLQISCQDGIINTSNSNNLTSLQQGCHQHVYDEGIDNFSDALPLPENETESCCVVILQYNIGQTHRGRNNYAHALQSFRYALELAFKEKMNKETERSALFVQILLAIGYCEYRLGNLVKALTNYEACLEHTRAFHLGDEMQASATVGVAVVRYHLSNQVESTLPVIELLEESIMLYKKCEEHKDKEIAAILNNIGRLHYLRGDFQSAMSTYGNALTIRRLIYQNDSTDLAITICNLGQTCHRLGRIDDALKHFNEFLELTESSTCTSISRDIFVISNIAANIENERRCFKSARRMYEKALVAGRIVYGSNHPQIATTLNRLGSVCYKMGDLDDALNYLQNGLEVEGSLYSPNHPNMLVTMLNMAQIYRNQSKFEYAFLTYSRVHAIQVYTTGPISLVVASTLFSMGLMLYRMKRYSSAFDYYQEALLVQLQLYGDKDHVEIAATLNSLGIVMFHLEKKALAKTYFEASLKMRQRLLGKYHFDVATNLFNLAKIHMDLGDDDVALELFKESLAIERKTNGEKNYELVPTLQNLGLVYQQRGQLNEAVEYFQEALELERSKNGDTRLCIAKMLNLIGNLYLQKGETTKMMKYFIEASEIYNFFDETLVLEGFCFYELSKMHPECAATA